MGILVFFLRICLSNWAKSVIQQIASFFKVSFRHDTFLWCLPANYIIFYCPVANFTFYFLVQLDSDHSPSLCGQKELVTNSPYIKGLAIHQFTQRATISPPQCLRATALCPIGVTVPVRLVRSSRRLLTLSLISTRFLSLPSFLP